MSAFVVRRLIASLFILLAATYLMYILVAFSGDPLEELRLGNAPNKEALIEARTALLHLDVTPWLRYFIWLVGFTTRPDSTAVSSSGTWVRASRTSPSTHFSRRLHHRRSSS